VPEGHTIHRLARDLNGDLAGAVLRVSSPQGRVPTETVDGARFERAEAVGKHLFLHFPDACLHVHLGLFGRFRRRKLNGAPPRDTIRLRLEGPRYAWELSGATASDWVDEQDISALLERIGPDPLSPRAKPKLAWERIHRSKRPLAALLLDQRVLSGVGNVYRAEILHLLSLHPELPGSELPRATFQKLWRLTKKLLARGVEEKTIRTVDKPSNRTKREALYVYGRNSCRSCQGRVVRVTLGQRDLHYCPTCQPRTSR
jgi:endonuclease-8